MPSVLFATKACYSIKDKGKSFCWRNLPFCRLRLRKAEAEKSELPGYYSIHHVSLNTFQSLLFYSELKEVCSNYVLILK